MQVANANPEIKVTGRHVAVTDAIVDYARKKVESLHLDYPRIIDAQVILDVEKYRHIAEVVLHCNNHITIDASAETPDLYASIDEAVGKIAQQMRKHKTKIMRQHRPRRGQIRLIEEQILADEAPEEIDNGSEPLVVRTEKYPVKPMFVDEAVLQLQMNTAQQFVVFLNAKSEKVNVLYRRKQGNFGVIEPVFSWNPKGTSSPLTVGEWYTRHSEALQLRLIGPAVGFDRFIREPTINRPGLALSGFFAYFAVKRIQVLGSAEQSYLKSLPKEEIRRRARDLFSRAIPCLVISRSAKPPPAVLEEAAAAGVAVFRTPMITMRFINAATILLESDFAPVISEYGSMVDILGIGVMIRGASGIGKSECVLGLIERGYSLVSDDMTRLRAIEGRDLIGTAPELTRHHMEVRGLGIINVASIFGISSTRLEKRLDLVVTLKDWQELEEVDRIGLEQEFFEILGILVPHVTIPVRTGRDLARLIEVAALDQKLKSMGQNSALEFNERLLRKMQKQSTD